MEEDCSRVSPRSSCERELSPCAVTGDSLEMDVTGGLLGPREEGALMQTLAAGHLSGALGQQVLFTIAPVASVPPTRFLANAIKSFAAPLQFISLLSRPPASFPFIFVLSPFSTPPMQQNRRHSESHPFPSPPKHLSELRHREVQNGDASVETQQEFPSSPCALANTSDFSDRKRGSLVE